MTMSMSAEMKKGTVAPIVLKLLAERDMYGYEMLKQVNERTDNVLAWKEATLYPWLHRLEQERFVRSEWRTSSAGRKRKYYTLTRRGATELEARVAEWRTLSASVSAILCTTGTA